MKAKTLLELATLSSTLYTISKETHLMEKLAILSEQGKDKINNFMKESVIDENGNEIEFMEKLVLKAHQVKEELEEKIGEVVASFYEKVNIAHTDKLKAVEMRIEQLSKDLALAEARINHLENKEK
jgi:polyhydroxyalkanoate synthesis regulator phasin